MDAPSMVQRDGDKLIVRRVVSGEEVFLSSNNNNNASSGKEHHHQQQQQSQSRPSSRASYADSFKEDLSKFGLILEDSSGKSDSGGGVRNNNNNNNSTSECAEQQLPQCKIKRNYSCSSCTYFTQNPRKYLTHLRDVHGEKIIINECKRCLYASRHYQKLVRHMKMVHGSTDGIKTPFSSRRRGTFRKEFFKKNKFKMNNNPVTPGGGSGGGVGGSGSGPSESQYSLSSSANYINQLMKSNLSKMFSGVNGGSGGGSGGGVGGGDSSTENSLFFPGNFKPGGGLTLAEQAQQLSSQLKGSSNINIFTDNGGTSSSSVAHQLGDSVNNDVLAMLQHNLVDKGKQLTITPAGSSSSEMASSRAKKRPRPIPDLIPLHSISQLHLTGEAGKTYHLNPEVTIKTRVASGENNSSSADRVVIVDDDDSPINLTADHHQQDDKGGGLQHQCIFCQIMVRTTDDLALHLRTFHSDELFALLLQKKPEESGQVEPPQQPQQQQPQQVQQTPQLFSAETLTIDIWKRLLENNKAILEEQEARENDSEMQSGQFSNDEDDSETVESAISKNDTYCGVETAPGYGEVTSKINLDGTPAPSTAIMKKVFKCPHCSFWASTASRFHVHIVGHLNKKPFECSLCAYRSNWRWDITKHIRLKTIRDPSHKNAGVLMNDETGRRNYTKYNRYITLMKVTDNSFKDASSSSKAMMLEANQADYLAMCKSGDQSSGGSSSSLAGPNAFNSLAKMYSSEELAQAFNLANMNQMARYEPEMLQSLMAGGLPKTLPPNDDDLPPSAPKVAFKCKKCNFKNPFREMVLLHIKSTHLSGSSDKSGADAEIDLCEDQHQHDQPSADPPAESPAATNNSTHNHHPTLSPLRTATTTSRTSTSSPGLVVPVTSSPRRSVVGVVVGGLAAAATAPTVDNSGSSSSGGAGSATAVANSPPSGGGTVVGFPSNNYTTTNATTLIGVGLNLTQAVVANDNRLGTTSTFTSFSNSNSTIPTTTTTTSVVSCGGEVDNSRTIGVSTPSTQTNTHSSTNSTGIKGTSSPPTASNASSSSSWRPSAPYRCGHCHQVSNWKHVIQRHCRLKHNGNVLIEMVNTAAKQQQQQQQNQPLTTTPTTSSNQQQPATGVSQNVTDLRNLKKVRKPFQSFDSVSQDITVQPVTLHPIELVPEVSLVVQEMPMVLIPIGDGGGPPPLTLLSPGPPVPLTTTTIPTSTTPMTFINLTEESSMELPPLVRTTTTTVTLPTPMQQTDTSDGVTEPEPEPEVVPVASSSRSKRYQCPACPYVTDSKTQFAYHKSFHKPRGDPYQCSECSYNVTKKHLLIQHQKTHMHSTASPVSEAPAKQPSGELSLVMGNATKSSGLTPAEILDLTKKMGHEVSITPAINNSSSSNNSTGKGQLVPKIVYYCKNCPARYLDESEIVIHQNKHQQQDKYKCDLCSFSTCDESGIANHRNVHGLNYRIVTAELRRHNVECERHPRPKIITIRVGDDHRDKAWVVKRDYEAMQPPEPEEPILVEDPIVIEDSAAVEDPVVVVEDPVPIIEESTPIEDPVIVEDPVPEVEPMQVEEPAPAPPTPPQPSPTPPPPPQKRKKTDPPRIRRSTRVKQTAPQPTKRTLMKKPPSSKQLYSCDHCDHTDKDEAALKDHVKFHFRDILFPRRVDGVEARRGPFRQKITMVDDPEQSFELRFDDEEEEEDQGDEDECPEEERIFIEI